MKQNYASRLLTASLLLVLTGCIVQPRPPRTVSPPPPPPPDYSASLQTPPPLPAQEQPEVLTRGPVHEAFAEPVNVKAQAGWTAPEQPPAAIAETPPALRPAGGGVVWVPGYWSWDADRKAYIWVSGCWRVAPPHRVWVPGYWARAGIGWQWIPGFWSLAGETEIAYLPPPPDATDLQPPGPPPSADVTWVPGCWSWQQGRYVARAGYWLNQQPGWVWVPAHYSWTPRGYVFVDGHWDRPWEQRGVLFAPVFFGPTFRARLGFAFSPSITLDLGAVSASLFAFPLYSHYYFGDYYDDSYARFGIYPWFECTRSPFWYDPIFVYARWHNRRTDPRWEQHERENYQHRHDFRDDRPLRTYRAQEERHARPNEPLRRDVQLGRPLSAVIANPKALRFERVTPAARERIVRQTTEVHTYQEARTRWEAEPATAKSPHPAPKPPERVRLPSHPFALSTEAEGSGERAPPNRPTAERTYERRGNDWKGDRKRDDR